MSVTEVVIVCGGSEVDEIAKIGNVLVFFFYLYTLTFTQIKSNMWEMLHCRMY